MIAEENSDEELHYELCGRIGILFHDEYPNRQHRGGGDVCFRHDCGYYSLHQSPNVNHPFEGETPNHRQTCGWAFRYL